MAGHRMRMMWVGALTTVMVGCGSRPAPPGDVIIRHAVDVPTALVTAAEAEWGPELRVRLDPACHLTAEPGDSTGAPAMPRWRVDCPGTAALIAARMVAARAQEQVGWALSVTQQPDGTVHINASPADHRRQVDDVLSRCAAFLEARAGAAHAPDRVQIARVDDAHIDVRLVGIADLAAAPEIDLAPPTLGFYPLQRKGRDDARARVAARRPTPGAWPAELDPALNAHPIGVGEGIRSTSIEVLRYMAAGQVSPPLRFGFEPVIVDLRDPNLKRVRGAVDARGLNALGTPPAPGATLARAYDLVLLTDTASMTVERLAQATVGLTERNQPVVNLLLSPGDGERLHEMTAQVVGRQVAITIEDLIVFAPRVREPIPGGRLEVSLGNAALGVAGAEDIVEQLVGGRAPAAMTVVDRRVVPSVGLSVH